jgi:hypothetical protein
MYPLKTEINRIIWTAIKMCKSADNNSYEIVCNIMNEGEDGDME